MAKLKILSEARKRAFNNVPNLDRDAKVAYFLIDIETKKLLNGIRSDIDKVGFLVSKAYFQAKGCFFNAGKFKPDDIQRAAKALKVKTIDIKSYSADAASRHKKLILAHFGWSAFKQENLVVLSAHASNLVSLRQNKEDILFSLIDYCWLHRIEIPSYNQLVELISASYADYDKQIEEKVIEYITSSQKSLLEDFFDNYGSRYSHSELKKVNQGTTQGALNKNAEMLSLYKAHYFPLKALMDKVQLTGEAVQHFSDTISLSDLSAIKRLKKSPKLHISLASFISDQFYKRQDFAADAIVKYVRSFINTSRGHERKMYQDKKSEIVEANKTVVSSAKDAHKVMKMVLALNNDETVSHEEKTERTRQLIMAFFTAENPDFEEHLAKVDLNISKITRQTDFYEKMFSQSMTIYRAIGRLVKAIDFDLNSNNQNLLDAIVFYNGEHVTIDEDTPVKFLNAAEQRLLFEEDAYNPIAKYRVLLFLAIAKALSNKDLTLKYSYRYRQTQSYIISDEEWETSRHNLLKSVSLDRFEDGKKILNDIGQTVTKLFHAVNNNIIAGNNPHFTLKGDGTWRIKYPDSGFSIAQYIPSLMSKSAPATLQDIMFEIEQHCEVKVSSCFTHRLPKGSSAEVDKRLMFATIMSLGTNLGHVGLSRASRLYSEKALRDTQRDWLSKTNLKKANDLLVKTIQSLPLPAIFNDEKGVLHSSSDGTKVVVNVDSLLANYSYKYYGKEQGVSVNSFIDEKQSFFHVNVLTSSDREAPFVLEGLASSKHVLAHDNVDLHLHSTDTHGYTEAVFAGLHFLDVSFAPRIKNVHEQTLYAFHPKSIVDHDGSPISPKSKINKKLILDHWDDILRLMTSIKLGRCSASQMLKMLSASERNSDLYRAFKEFGRLLKTHFILNYVNDEDLRKSIQKQLNRAELGQALTKEIFFGRKGKLQVGLKSEVELVMLSNTLLRNMVILWNYLFLSDHCLSLDSEEEKQDVIKSIASGSVISWGHINFMGVYDFVPPETSSFKSTFKQMMDVKI